MPFRAHRLARLWLAAGAFGRRDPTLFIAIFALWMLLSGLSLLAPGSAYDATPVYSLAREYGLAENVVGASMVCDAAVLAWCLGDRPPGVRAWIACMSGALWVFWSVLMFFSALRAGFMSAGAVWTVIASVCLIRSAWPLSGMTSGGPVELPPPPPSPREWQDQPTLREASS